MLTRRQCLALLPAGLAAAQIPPSFERVDTHVHLNRLSRPIIAGLQKSGFRALSICVSRATGNDPSDLETQLRGTAEMSRESGGRIAWAGSFDARLWQQSDFAGSTIAALKQQFAAGAIAVKIWKNIGMSLRYTVGNQPGNYILPDDAAFLPIYEMLQKEDRTLIAHLAEPNGAWMPLDANNPEIEFYGSHREWYMYGRSDAPSKEAILAARDRIVTRYPKLRVVGCHLGSNEEDLKALAARLDRLPNFAVDLAARIRYLVAARDQASVREFLIRYQDRVTYGTDFTLGRGGDDQRASTDLASVHDRDWKYFSGSKGLRLPPDVLRKIFRENALRWFPGLA